MSELAEREFEALKNSILSFVSEKKGHCQFEELDAWGRERGLPRLTLRIALNELIEAGELKGSATAVEVDDFAPWVKIPREITSEKPAKPLSKAIPPLPSTRIREEVERPIDQDFEAEPKLRRVIEYLNDYPSVGLMRFNLDLQGLQVTDTDRLLRRLSEDGFVEVSPLGIVNATPRLPKITRKVTLGDLIGSNS